MSRDDPKPPAEKPTAAKGGFPYYPARTVEQVRAQEGQMSTGLFSTSTAQGIGARRHQRLRRAADELSTLDRFADRLAEHGVVARPAKEIGKSDSYGHVLFAKLKRRLGSQAC